ncbi:hypothetical protein TVNIR_0998 [Thioalkalivibrio nitratireducens DSM 14787]|uniref:Uncharacterized protein n=1 Tax=Thioalkalivibrio nitratireducens (strain DSM 14787 / UNIQEM 213 / ALEN2) TaxID=1255043 RepID=L0DUK3_THIND|nr:hypothetical protein [Thioalkalivibrio nitratireducens]AGA32682.1 hypothetical protein TVNIR_0998 [Thioalkalivibrio nitratireducens DSM 14787]
MKHLKTFALGALLFPAMAFAQTASADTYYQPGQPVPGADDHPAHSGSMPSRGKPDEPYYRKDQPIPGADDHPGMTGEQEAGEPTGDYYDRGQPIPGAGDHPSFDR